MAPRARGELVSSQRARRSARAISALREAREQRVGARHAGALAHELGERAAFLPRIAAVARFEHALRVRSRSAAIEPARARAARRAHQRLHVAQATSRDRRRAALRDGAAAARA